MICYQRKFSCDGATLHTQIPICGTTGFETDITKGCISDRISMFQLDVFNGLVFLLGEEKAPETTFSKWQVTKTVVETSMNESEKKLEWISFMGWRRLSLYQWFCTSNLKGIKLNITLSAETEAKEETQADNTSNIWPISQQTTENTHWLCSYWSLQAHPVSIIHALTHSNPYSLLTLWPEHGKSQPHTVDSTGRNANTRHQTWSWHRGLQQTQQS